MTRRASWRHGAPPGSGPCRPACASGDENRTPGDGPAGSGRWPGRGHGLIRRRSFEEAAGRAADLETESPLASIGQLSRRDRLAGRDLLSEFSGFRYAQPNQRQLVELLRGAGREWRLKAARSCVSGRIFVDR